MKKSACKCYTKILIFILAYLCYFADLTNVFSQGHSAHQIVMRRSVRHTGMSTTPQWLQITVKDFNFPPCHFSFKSNANLLSLLQSGSIDWMVRMEVGWQSGGAGGGVSRQLYSTATVRGKPGTDTVYYSAHRDVLFSPYRAQQE